MGPLKGAVLLALLFLACTTRFSLSQRCSGSSCEQCQGPEWDVSAGPNPFLERRGKVVLVALLKGYCGYCVWQATVLHRLKTQLIQHGYPDIDMLIVNGGEPTSRDMIQNLIDASPIPVLQDTPDHVLYRQVFNASKDDFVVYDRCNQEAFYIPRPLSDLRRSTTQRVLMTVHSGLHGCFCSLDHSPTNTDVIMVGDDPGVRPFHHRHILQCRSDDRRCRILQRAINRENRRNGLRLGGEQPRRRLGGLSWRNFIRRGGRLGMRQRGPFNSSLQRRLVSSDDAMQNV